LSTSAQYVEQFESLDDWKKFGPDLGSEYFPKFNIPTQTYQQWLQENPQGVVGDVLTN